MPIAVDTSYGGSYDAVELAIMSAILDIAARWSYWDKPLPPSIPREVALPKQLRDNVALVIQGVRRCGKSTLMRQLVTRYRLNPKHCVFLNCEDPRLGFDLNYRVLDGLVTAFRDRHKRSKKLYFFLDEVQHVDRWQPWLTSQLERPSGNHFVLTGSNGQLLSGELATALTGRHLALELFPFSLAEARKRLPALVLAEYLAKGGFPEPLAQDDGDWLRAQYFSDIVERDLRERLRAPSSLDVKRVVQIAYESAGSELSMRRLAGAAGVDSETAKRYLESAENAYLLFSCPFFAYSARKSAAYNRKFYPVDTGLWRCTTTPTSHNHGKLLEVAVFIALRRMGHKPAYWRADGEVDFVIAKDRRSIPIQVTWDRMTDRHERALESFYATFPNAEESICVTRHNFPSAIRL